MWNIHTVECCSAIKNDNMKLSDKWMKVEKNLLEGGVSDIQQQIWYAFTYYKWILDLKLGIMKLQSLGQRGYI